MRREWAQQRSVLQANRRCAVITRVLAVLTLVLFGFTFGQTDRQTTLDSQVAQTSIETIQGILSCSRHSVQAPLLDDTVTDILTAYTKVSPLYIHWAVLPRHQEHASLEWVAHPTPPPVRGPPSV